MSADLTALERAAARCGLPGLQARLVPPARRRDAWFRWTGAHLDVSERIVERLSPPEACALLVDVILHERGLQSLRRGLLAGAAGAVLAAAAVYRFAPGALPWVCLVLGAGLVVWASMGWSRAALAADDATVARLDQPELLVRALNRMDQDELHLARWAVKARPDLHRRAERLVRRHELRLPPELRGAGQVGEPPDA